MYKKKNDSQLKLVNRVEIKHNWLKKNTTV